MTRQRLKYLRTLVRLYSYQVGRGQRWPGTAAIHPWCFHQTWSLRPLIFLKKEPPK